MIVILHLLSTVDTWFGVWCRASTNLYETSACFCLGHNIYESEQEALLSKRQPSRFKKTHIAGRKAQLLASAVMADKDKPQPEDLLVAQKQLKASPQLKH